MDQSENLYEAPGISTPEPEPEKRQPLPLGGWLILVGIGVVLRPIILLVEFGSIYVPMFTQGTWEAISSPESESYWPALVNLLIGEMIYNVLIFSASLFLGYLFFSKSHHFPKVFIAILVVTVFATPIDNWALSRVMPDQTNDAEVIMEFIRGLIPCLIWVPYMLVSKRVKQTFVKKVE